MTETFRTGIHDTVRNLPPPSSFGDARDMKTRDYARAIRKHRVDPCAGSLLHAHMSSLELDTVGASSSAPFGAGAAGPGCLRQCSSLGTFRSRFSPPFAGYSRGRSGNNGGSGGFGLEEVGTRGTCSAPAEGRQALLRRELSSVQLAAANVAGVSSPPGGGGSCDIIPAPVGARTATVDASMEEGLHESGRGESRGKEGGRQSTRAQQGGGGGSAKASPQEGVPLSDAELDRRRGDGGKNGRVGFPRSRQDGEKNSVGFADGWNSCGDIRVGDADESAWRKNSRARERRRGRHTGQGSGNTRPEDSRDGPLAATPEPTLSSCNSRSRATPMAAGRTTRKPGSRRHHRTSAVKPRHLKKPFSSDSLLSCLLDVRFGNTRDLSPAKPPGQKWDLRTIPAGITAGVMSAAPGGWDGFDESEDLAGRPSIDEAGTVDPSYGPRGSDFAVVCGGNEFGDSNGERERGRGRKGPSGSA